MSESDACAELETTLAVIGAGAKRMAVGHNIVPFIASRCDGALQLLDVGMSSAYEGAASAAVLRSPWLPSLCRRPLTEQTSQTSHTFRRVLPTRRPPRRLALRHRSHI